MNKMPRISTGARLFDPVTATETLVERLQEHT